MKLSPLFVLSFALLPGAAIAGSAQGPGALALATLVAERAPQIGLLDKHLLTAYLDGRANTPHAKGKKIVVKAEAIDCRASNVDITSHACDLTFGAKKIALAGRRAHELYATLAEVGVVPDGAAGTIHEAVTNLDCTIDADAVQEKAGGGAVCAFSP